MSEEKASDKQAQEASGNFGGNEEETLKMAATEMIKRRSRWQSSLASLRYIDSVSRDNEVQLRDTDRATSLALVVVCILAAVSLFFPQMSPHRIPLILSADLLVGVGLLMYVANRFGIVTTLTPRQALLTWQLMLGASLLGIFTCINLGLIILIVVGNTHIVIPR